MGADIGQKAPEFTLVDTEKKERSLKEFSGKNTVLAFFPGAFTGVCTKEMCTFRDSMAQFNGMKTQVVAVSVDSPFANKAFADVNKLTFPVLSDLQRTVSRQYGGVMQDFAGIKGYEAAKRAVFVLDAGGTVRYKWVSDNPGVEPDYAAITKALGSLGA